MYQSAYDLKACLDMLISKMWAECTEDPKLTPTSFYTSWKSYKLAMNVLWSPTGFKRLFFRMGGQHSLAYGMDTAKAVGARFVNPHRSLQQLKGLLKVRHNTPLMIAIPTTAGTGSEATLAAVVVNPKTKDKFSINDPHLIPEVAVLDNSLLRGLPPSVIAMPRW